MHGLVHGIVLCAGLGVRLRPLTDVRPKPLLRFLGRPIVSYSIDMLADAGVTEFGVNAHEHVDQVSQFFQGYVRSQEQLRQARFRSEVAVEPTLLGTGGGAWGIWQALGAPNAPTYVINGDIVCDLDIETLFRVHRRTGAVATLLTIPAIPGEGAVTLDEGGHFVARLPGRTDVATAPGATLGRNVSFGGIYVIEPRVLQRMGESNLCLIRDGLAPLLQAGESIAVYEHDGFWADLGTASRFLRATADVLANPAIFARARLPEATDGVYVAPSARISPTARLIAPVYVGPGAVVLDGAEVGPNVWVGPDCGVDDGAIVKDSVLSEAAVARGGVSRQWMVADRVLRSP